MTTTRTRTEPTTYRVWLCPTCGSQVHGRDGGWMRCDHCVFHHDRESCTALDLPALDPDEALGAADMLGGVFDLLREFNQEPAALLVRAAAKLRAARTVEVEGE